MGHTKKNLRPLGHLEILPLAHISGPSAYFSKPIFALKPRDRVGQCEYHLLHGNGMGKHCQLIKIPHFGFFEPPSQSKLQLSWTELPLFSQ